MAVFDIAIMENTNVLPAVNKVGQYVSNVEESYFNEALNFVLEMNKQMTGVKIGFYRSVAESADEQAVNESFGEFFDKVKEIIDKFIAFFKSLIDRFITMLFRMVKADKHLFKHAADFSKFDDMQHQFTFKGYNFTFSENIPHISPEDEYREGVDINFSNISNFSSDEIKNAYGTFMDNLSDNYYDRLRGSVINHSESISSDRFEKELFSEYRDGRSDKTEITATSMYVSECYNRFSSYEKTKNSVETSKRKVEASYKKVKEQLSRLVTSSKSSGGITVTINPNLGTDEHLAKYGQVSAVPVSAENLNSIEQYAKAKVNQIQQMTNIHALAFAKKLDALKDCYKQDKVVLYKALDRIQRLPKKSK